jgi:hypothetical protein
VVEVDMPDSHSVVVVGSPEAEGVGKKVELVEGVDRLVHLVVGVVLGLGNLFVAVVVFGIMLQRMRLSISAHIPDTCY